MGGKGGDLGGEQQLMIFFIRHKKTGAETGYRTS